jgi:acetolactate synthase-1/3 small subunit
VQLTGTGAEVNAFLTELSAIGRVLELVRSGTAALQSGDGVLALPA